MDENKDTRVTVYNMRDKMREKNIPLEVEPLDKFEAQPLTILRFELRDSEFQEGASYALMECVDGDGVKHIVSCGGAVVLRALMALDPVHDFPVEASLKRMPTGGGFKAWTLV